MKAKTLLLIVLLLAVFFLQGCNGPDGGGREAPYSTSAGSPGDEGAGTEALWVVSKPGGERGTEGEDAENRETG